MVSLKDQIDTAQRYLRQMQMRVREQEAVIEELENRRAYCEHKFSQAVKGYEHEGGHCVKCGINELYAPTQKKMVLANNQQ